MQNLTDLKQFKRELSELLQKHNVYIQFACDDSSDTFGLYDDHLAVIDKITGKEFTLSDSWDYS